MHRPRIRVEDHPVAYALGSSLRSERRALVTYGPGLTLKQLMEAGAFLLHACAVEDVHGPGARQPVRFGGGACVDVPS